MAWIEKKEKWFEPKRQKSNGSKSQRSYSVSEVAHIMGVSRQTVFKWLSIDEPEIAMILPSAWWRTDSGYIMIKESALIKFQRESRL